MSAYRTFTIAGIVRVPARNWASTWFSRSTLCCRYARRNGWGSVTGPPWVGRSSASERPITLFMLSK